MKTWHGIQKLTIFGHFEPTSLWNVSSKWVHFLGLPKYYHVQQLVSETIMKIFPFWCYRGLAYLKIDTPIDYRNKKTKGITTTETFISKINTYYWSCQSPNTYRCVLELQKGFCFVNESVYAKKMSYYLTIFQETLQKWYYVLEILF